MKSSRSYSDRFQEGSSDVDLFQNKNVNWIEGRATKIFYLLSVFIIWGILHVSQLLTPRDCILTTNIIHGIVNIYLFILCK